MNGPGWAARAPPATHPHHPAGHHTPSAGCLLVSLAPHTSPSHLLQVLGSGQKHNHSVTHPTTALQWGLKAGAPQRSSLQQLPAQPLSWRRLL